MKSKVLGLSMVLIVSLSSAATALDERIVAMPDDASVAFYQDNAGEIDRLVVQLGAEVAPEERAAALRALIDQYPEAAFYAALDLVADSDLKIALMAVDFVSTSVVMSDHPHNHKASPAQFYIMAKHEAGRQALRSVLLDERGELREKAAVMLASLSDAAALAIIDDGVASGIYSDVEAINVFAMADTEVGGPLMAEYLDGGSADAQASAVIYLGATPEYQELVRNDIFLNPLATASVRTQAAATLSQYDSTFSEYALTVTSDPTVDPGLYAQTIGGYLSSAGADGQVITPATLKALEAGVSNYTVFRQDNAPIDASTLGRLDELRTTIRDLSNQM